MPYRLIRHHRMVFITVLLTLLFTTLLPTTFAQQDNLCRNQDLPIINFGEVLTGTAEPNFPVSVCFEAERGSTVTITVQPLSQGLFPALEVGTPFFDATNGFLDEPLISEVATGAGVGIQATANIEADGTYLISVLPVNETRGSFDLTLELSGGNVLGANPSTDTDTPPDDNGQNTGTADEILYGQTDLCTTPFSTALAYGDTADGSASDAEPTFYCFEATEGDIVTIDFTITDTPMVYLLVDPFYDLTEAMPRYAEIIAQEPNETITREIVIPRDGQYVIFVIGVIPETLGDFSLALEGFAGNVYTCQNDPIQTIVNNVWRITDDNGTILIELVATCSQRISVSALGGASIVPFNVTQDDEAFFIYRGRAFTTSEFSDSSWTLERDDGETFTFSASDGAQTCEDETISALVQGSWFWELDPTQRLFLDFSCAGTVFVDDTQTEPILGTYVVEDDVITMDVSGQPVEFSDIVISDEVLTANVIIGDFEAIPFELPNALYDAPDEATEEE